jgi:hypothetical protein
MVKAKGLLFEVMEDWVGKMIVLQWRDLLILMIEPKRLGRGNKIVLVDLERIYRVR